MRFALFFNLLVLLCLASGFVRWVSRSEYPVRPDALPAKIQALLEERFPGAQVLRAERRLTPDPDRYCIKLNDRGRRVVLLIQKPARIVEQRWLLAPYELPEALKARLRPLPGLDHLLAVWKIVRTGEPVFYRIRFYDSRKHRIGEMKLTSLGCCQLPG